MHLITKLPWMPEEALYILDKRLKVGTLSKLVKVCLLEKNEWNKTNIFFYKLMLSCEHNSFCVLNLNSGGKCEMSGGNLYPAFAAFLCNALRSLPWVWKLVSKLLQAGFQVLQAPILPLLPKWGLLLQHCLLCLLRVGDNKQLPVQMLNIASRLKNWRRQHLKLLFYQAE